MGTTAILARFVGLSVLGGALLQAGLRSLEVAGYVTWPWWGQLAVLSLLFALAGLFHALRVVLEGAAARRVGER